ncbi:hypothetical protein ESB00_01600 [Oleiharenicola lentus]|uniref:Uncharacterized protein n=1 Tax=Oleiharenicola lentus TaxID=2508720 RepID=A0A4Q1C719_9BACT|nr:hypothetical protein [Oleiharenicola lentus]RXK54618.1 hypothetical protein ESB00_01600 [Oleiharenicola lentus]
MTPEELEKFIHRELRALPPRKAPAGFEARMQAALASRTTQSAAAPVRLEQLVHRELRALPMRKAPAGFEARVLAEIERRAAVAWYHKSWSYWPAPVRAAFLAVGTGFAAAAVATFYLLSQGAAAETVMQEVATGFGWISRITGVVSWTYHFGRQLVADLPPLWLYGGLAFIAAMYATFVGLGAAAYRYLYRNN